MKLIHPFGTVVDVDDDYGAVLLTSGYKAVDDGASRSGGRSKTPRKTVDRGRDDASGDAAG